MHTQNLIKSDLPGQLAGATSLKQLRMMSPLNRDAQEVLDNVALDVNLDRLTIVADALASGLTLPLANPFGVGDITWHEVSEQSNARNTRQPGSEGEKSLADKRPVTIPNFATTADFELSRAEIEMSQRIGTPLDTSGATAAVRAVNSLVENNALFGADIQIDSNTTPGLLNFTDRNKTAYVDTEGWNAAGHSGEDILEDVLTLRQAALDKNFFGPFAMYVDRSVEKKLGGDFKTGTDKSLMQRLLEVDLIDSISVSDRLPVDRTLLYQKTTDVFRMIEGQRPTMISWQSLNGLQFFFLVIAYMVPNPRSNYNRDSGIVTGSPDGTL